MKIKAYLPVHATAEFEIAAPDKWDEMTKLEQMDYFYTHMVSTSGSVCHHCAEVIETDFEVVDQFTSNETDWEFYKEVKDAKN